MSVVSVNCVGDSWSYAAGGYYYKANQITASRVTGAGVGTTPRKWLCFKSANGALIRNYALSGSRLTDLQTQATELDALLPSGYSATGGRPQRKYILCVFVGINVNDNNPTTFAASVGAYCQARKSAGWNRVLLGTLPHRGDNIIANFDTAYKTPYNNIIKGAGWAAANGVDAIVDCTSIVEISSDGASSNVAYDSYWNADNVHLTDAGHELWKVPWQTAIEAAILELQ